MGVRPRPGFWTGADTGPDQAKILLWQFWATCRVGYADEWQPCALTRLKVDC